MLSCYHIIALKRSAVNIKFFMFISSNNIQNEAAETFLKAERDLRDIRRLVQIRILDAYVIFCKIWNSLQKQHVFTK